MLLSLPGGENVAQRRMVSLTVVDTDLFLDLPVSSQALYFHLNARGDDDGFVGSPRKIARAVGCNEDDIRLLAVKGFLIPFESGVVVIRDWKLNNYIKPDRYHETVYLAEKSMLYEDSAHRWQLVSELEPNRIQSGTNTEPEVSIDKVSLEEGRFDPPSPSDRKRFIPPTPDEVRAYAKEKGFQIDADRFCDFYASNGWRVGKNAMKDWKPAARNWARREQDKKPTAKEMEPDWV